MEYSKLVAVSGLPGLFELIANKTDGAILRSVETRATQFVSTRIHQFSQLESIEVYTIRDNVNLVDIFSAMDEAGVSLPDDKDAAAVRNYFEKVFPDMDFERVYNSDMKKMVKWYAVLKKNNVEIKLTELPEEEEPETSNEVAVEAEEKKPAKKTKTAAKEPAKEPVEKNTAKAKTAEKPAKKKAAAKEKEETPKKKAAAKKK